MVIVQVVSFPCPVVQPTTVRIEQCRQEPPSGVGNTALAAHHGNRRDEWSRQAIHEQALGLDRRQRLVVGSVEMIWQSSLCRSVPVTESAVTQAFFDGSPRRLMATAPRVG